MEPRYCREAMTAVWQPENMYRLWLDVEIAASQAWTSLGVVPEADMAKIREFYATIAGRWPEKTSPVVFPGNRP